MNGFRIKGAGRLDPEAALTFTFDGRRFSGVAGDTLASALLANGVHLVGRSFKYHRPRGILSAGAEEPNALVGIRRDAARHSPNVRATVQELYQGLDAVSQNRWPSLAFDLGAAGDLVSPMLPAGFYYKTFMWPAQAWAALYEPRIRAAAGLGRSPTEPDPDHYGGGFLHCDVLIVGAGPAGIAAALAAAESGLRVILADENALPGGSLRGDSGSRIDGQDAYSWVEGRIAHLATKDNVRILTRTTAFGYYAQNMVALAERVTDHLSDPHPDLPRERLWQVRARRVVLATGAIERHPVFPDNDRPGIMLASAARHYLNHHGVAPGAKVGVFAANDSAYAAAIDLAGAGVRVAAIVDIRDNPSGARVEEARSLGIEILHGRGVVGTSGRLRIRSMSIRPKKGGAERRIAVDALLVSAGWTPSVHLFSQSRGKLVYDEATRRYLPGETMQDCVSVGSCAGAEDLATALKEGYQAGERAAKALAIEQRKLTRPKVEANDGIQGGVLGAGPGAGPGSKAKAFVDFQNDVTAKDIRLAVREGMHSIEHVKRFTTNGMATDQGKTSNMHGLAIAAEALDRDIPAVGLTTFRPPYTPVTFGALVSHAKGPLFDPVRRTPIDGWARENGAVFEDVGQWKRARFFPRDAEDMHAAVNRECRTVRTSAGVFDASTLGKIEVVGPDAAAFLDLLYVNNWQSLQPGRCRYGIMLREDGFIYDDGVIGRMAEDRFHVTTTTGGAARVLHHMEDYLQTEFPTLRVWLTSTTEQWAVIAVQGPKAREIVSPMIEGIDLTPEAMPHMAVREGRILGVPCRLFRVSFTGELGYEINVPADFGRAVWEAVHERTQESGGCAYGTEAMHVLRAEKGYIIVGQETDGTVTCEDAGLGWAVGKKKPDFVGIRGMRRSDLLAEDRKQLVGLKTVDPDIVLEEGAQIVDDPAQKVPMTMVGHVTSSYWSENCGRSIALALLKRGRARFGERVFLPMPDGVVEAEICETVFIDPKGERING